MEKIRLIGYTFMSGILSCFAVDDLSTGYYFSGAFTVICAVVFSIKLTKQIKKMWDK